MLKINVQADIDRALSKLARINSEVSDKAVMRALNRTADMAKTQAAREIAAVGYNLKSAAIKKAIAVRKASTGNLVAVVSAQGRQLPLINYATSRSAQKSNGVMVNVKNGRKLLKGAFIATMSSGHTGIFRRGAVIRKGTAAKPLRRFWKYQVISEEFGPGIPTAFINKTVQAALIEGIRERFPARLKHEMRNLALK